MWSYWWGRYNSFCRSLGARGARGERGGLKGFLDKNSFFKVRAFLIYEYCLYLLAKPFASIFQPQYVDGLLNPRHRKLSFTTELATLLGIALYIWGLSIFFSFSYFLLYQRTRVERWMKMVLQVYINKIQRLEWFIPLQTKVYPSSPSILLFLLLLQETCKTNNTFLKPNRLYERRLYSMKHENIIW